MPHFQVYRFAPQGAFHFGMQGIDAERSGERCPSDTLYSALMLEAQFAGRPFPAPATDAPDQQAQALPFVLSSCYPYVGSVLLLPYPRLKLPLSEGVGKRKLFKHLEYVSPTIFRLIIEQDTALEQYLTQRGRLFMGGQVWIAKEDGAIPKEEAFWSMESTPHVTVDRVAHTSAYYQTGHVRFAPGCGLYVLCHEQTPDGAAGLLELLHRLGDSGLGGRRSRGLGQFTVSRDPNDLVFPDASEPRRLVLLSRYRPSEAELRAGVLGPDASYQIVNLSGWLQTTHSGRATAAQRRRNVRLLSEGSVIAFTPNQVPVGTICDLRPVYATAAFPHPVWRYGVAMGVGIGA